MRNQALTGYVLHQAAYGESRSLIYLFSQEFGMIHGLGKKNLPLFMPISLFANGKKSLKTFSQSQIGAGMSSGINTLTGQGLFAGLYLNEVLVKLLPIEQPMPLIWDSYQNTIQQIATIFTKTVLHNAINNDPLPKPPDDLSLLKFLLRQFEHQLFDELGYGIDLHHDSVGDTLVSTQAYRYRLQQGFVPIASEDLDRHSVTGQMIEQWQQWLTTPLQFINDYQQQPTPTRSLLNQISHSYRMVIDDLLDYQTLQSRELWRQLNQLSI